MWVVYGILLTVPITVAPFERNFSKLELIKSCIWSTMSIKNKNKKKEKKKKIEWSHIGIYWKRNFKTNWLQL